MNFLCCLSVQFECVRRMPSKGLFIACSLTSGGQMVDWSIVFPRAFIRSQLDGSHRLEMNAMGCEMIGYGTEWRSNRAIGNVAIDSKQRAHNMWIEDQLQPESTVMEKNKAFSEITVYFSVSHFECAATTRHEKRTIGNRMRSQSECKQTNEERRKKLLNPGKFYNIFGLIFFSFDWNVLCRPKCFEWVPSFSYM